MRSPRVRLCVEPAAFGFGMQSGVEDADDVEVVVCLFVDDNIGETGNGEFMRSIYGVTAAGEEIERFVQLCKS